MTIANSIISVKKILHREKDSIALLFPYHSGYIQKIKSLPHRKYSKTHQCWYIPYYKASYAAFRKLALPYHIEQEENKHKKIEINSGTAQGTLPDQLHTAKEQAIPSPPSDDLGNKERPSTDIFRAQAGKITIQFSRKVFILAIPYDAVIIKQIKQLKKAWWNTRPPKMAMLRQS